MRKFELVLKEFEGKEIKFLLEKAKALLDLITDEQLLELYTTYPNLFGKLSNISKLENSKEYIETAIQIFTETLDEERMSLEEFDSLSLDEIKDYVGTLVYSKEDDLLEIINSLEDIYK